MDILYRECKKEFTDRRIDIRIIVATSLLTIITIALNIIVNVFYPEIYLYVIIDAVMVFITLTADYTILFIMTKRKIGFKAKHYFNIKKVLSGIRTVQKKDVDIIKDVLVKHGIENKQIPEILHRYGDILNRTKPKSIEILSIIALSTSIMALIFQGLKTDMSSVYIAVISCVLVLIAAITISFKSLNKAIFYNISEYALYQRIESALFEIYLTAKPTKKQNKLKQ